ncbi:MAG TPA: enoyl-CoA hydratase-related protein [Candidatus Sulfotelmatobacter sp.]|nr:enoyl-CoA hydratase-related protein [Candidatus Sulfotelmatobacter sp.]
MVSAWVVVWISRWPAIAGLRPSMLFSDIVGAALGLITGWGGTQRLPRLIGKARALQMFIEAEKVHAIEALRVGLVDAIAEDPIAEAMRRIQGWVRA